MSHRLTAEAAPEPLSALAEVFADLAGQKARCGVCRQEILGGGVCADCGARRIAENRADAIRKAVRREIPEMFRENRWTSLDLPNHVSGGALKIASARKALEQPKVVLVGEAGSGKTTLALCHLAERLEAGARRARFVASRHLLGASYIEGISWYDLALSADLLILDDLGAELAGAPAGSGLAAQRIEVVSRLLCERYDQGRGHVITTAHDRASIAATYGDGVARRVFENAAIVRLT